MKLAGKILDFFVFGNIIVSLGAAGLTELTLMIIESDNHTLTWFTFCSTIIIYNLSLIVGNRKLKSVNSPVRRHKWLLRNNKLLIACSVISLPFMLYFLAGFAFSSILFLLPFALLSAAYAIPVKLGGISFTLRETGVNKIFLITLMWGATTVLFPIIEAKGFDALVSPEVLILFLNRLFFIFAITVPFDIRDLSYDGEVGVSTIPKKIGEARAKSLSMVIMGFFLITSILLYYPFLFISYNIMAGLVISGITTSVMLLYVNRDRPEYYFSFLLESTSFLQLLFVMIFTTIR